MATLLESLLEKAAMNDLTIEEQRELERLLGRPENAEQIDRLLAAGRGRLGAMLAYRSVLRARCDGAMPAAGREALEKKIESLRAGQARPAPRGRLRSSWGVPVLLAACGVLAFWIVGVRSEKSTGAVEFGMIARDLVTRGPAFEEMAGLSEEWRMVHVPDLKALAAWSAEMLPRDVQARIWLDEESELLRGVARRPDGTIVRAERALERHEPLANQARRFAASLTGDVEATP